MIYLSYVFLAISCSSIGGMYIVLLVRNRKPIPSFDTQVKESLDKYFEEINKEKYIERGLYWRVVDGHYWVELRVISQIVAEKRLAILKS